MKTLLGRNPPRDHARILPSTGGMVLLGAVLASGAASGAAAADRSSQAPSGGLPQASVRMGFSSGIFGTVDRADAQAAVVAWGEAILKHSGVFVDPKPFIAEDFDDLLAVLMAKRVDAVVLRTTEFLSMPPSVLDNDFIYSNRRAHGECEQYVVIARDDPRHRDVSDLRGKRLIVWANDRASLALPWLETFLAERRLPPVAEFFGTRSSAEKISTTVLPVFFGQSDVCLVTRSGFEDMVELNPQVGKTLQILATSPDVVPSFFCFRAGFDSPYRDNIEKAILSLHESTDGAQVLTTFQCEQIVRRPVSTLETSRRIYQAWCDLQRGRPSSQGPSTPGSAHGRTR